MSNEEKKDTVLQEEANKVAEDAAKEKAEAVDAQAADEGSETTEPDAKEAADKADAEIAAKFEQQFVRLQADFAYFKNRTASEKVFDRRSGIDA